MAKPRRPRVILRETANRTLKEVVTFDFVFAITLRKAGYEVRSSTRDTYDTGALLRSIVLKQKEDGNYTVSYTAPYAETVFESRPELLKVFQSNLNVQELTAGMIQERIDEGRVNRKVRVRSSSKSRKRRGKSNEV